MQHPLQVTFRHMDASDAVAAPIRERTEELDRFFHQNAGTALTSTAIYSGLVSI